MPDAIRPTDPTERGPRVVLIAGATGPLGRAAAAAFAADGAQLALVGTDAGRLSAMASELGLPDSTTMRVVADLRLESASREAVAAVISRFGRIDVLLHLVGGWTGGTAIVDLEPDVLASMLDRHVWSTFHLARAVVPGMTDRGWGRIIAVTSTTTSSPGPRAAAYTAAKAAQEAMLRVLAREVAGDGITVNLLAVKVIDAGHERDTARSAKTADWTTPEELVAAIRFLCSNEAAALSGTRIPMDRRG